MNDPHSYPQPNLSRLPSNKDLIIGTHALTEVLRHAPERLITVFTVPAAKTRKQELLIECEKRGVPIQYLPNERLTKMVGTDAHQSLVAHVRSRRFYEIREFLEKHPDQAFILMMDQIFDPQNFGALLRCAECFGVDGVAWSKNRGCDITPLVTKASCGASELLPLLRLSNLANAVDKLKEAGFEIVAATPTAEAEPLENFTYSPRTVLIVGSEGEGIQPLLLKKADRFVAISLKGDIASLNVAQATAILLHWKNT